jgi:hypothetical protein
MFFIQFCVIFVQFDWKDKLVLLDVEWSPFNMFLRKSRGKQKKVVEGYSVT